MTNQQQQAFQLVRPSIISVPLGQQQKLQQQYSPMETVLLERLRAQIEYYLSPANLAKDTFLSDLMKTHDGGVPINIIAHFPNVRALCSSALQTPLEDPADTKWLILAVQPSVSVMLNADGTMLLSKETSISPFAPFYYSPNDTAVTSPAWSRSSEGSVSVHPIPVVYQWPPPYPVVYMAPGIQFHYPQDILRRVDNDAPPRQVFFPDANQTDQTIGKPKRFKKRPTRKDKRNSTTDAASEQSSRSSTSHSPELFSPSTDPHSPSTTTSVCKQDENLTTATSPSNRRRRASHRRSRRKKADLDDEFPPLAIPPKASSCKSLLPQKWALVVRSGLGDDDDLEDAMDNLSFDSSCLLPPGA